MSGYKRMKALMDTPEAREKTVAYIADHLSFLGNNERVLLCYPDRSEGSIGWMFEQAVRSKGGLPIWLDRDRRWKSLLRQAFSSRASVIIGEPLVILGLTKLAKHRYTPLYIRHAVTAGYPCLEWMRSAIVRGLDCNTWGCYDPVGIVAGFSCPSSLGVHLRTDVFRFEQDRESGEVILIPKDHPDLKVHTGTKGELLADACLCGEEASRLMNIATDHTADPDLEQLRSMLHNWSSILDCKVERGQYGLELELVVFSGEKLPKLPSCAKQVIRGWDPETDVPFGMDMEWKFSDLA